MKLIKPIVMALGILFGLNIANAAVAEDVNLSGGFQNIEQRTSGNWRIETRGDATFVVLSEDFKARSAPDLKIFLSKLPAGDVDDDNATDGVFIAALKSHKGAQEFQLPAGVNVADFQSFVIHCEKYSKFWAAGQLR